MTIRSDRSQRPWVILSMLAVASICVLWPWGSPAHADEPMVAPHQASTRTPTPTPTATALPTRSISWLTSATASAPGGLQRTAGLLPTTGGNLEGAYRWPLDQMSPAVTLTPTPIPTRSIGWLNRAAGQAPRSLPRTFAFMPFGGGGGPLPPNDVCDNFAMLCRKVLTSPASPAWVVYPQSDSITLGVPGSGDATLGVTACRDTQGAFQRITLTDPAGRKLPTAAPEGPPDVSPCEWPQPYTLYDLPNGSQPGRYTLSVQDSGTVLTATWQITYPAPSIRLRQDYFTLNENDQLHPGEHYQIDYLNFRKSSGSSLAVGLYRLNECGTMLKVGHAYHMLIDSWRVSPDLQGYYTEEIVLPADAPLGKYLLAACSLEECDALDIAEGPMGQIALDPSWMTGPVGYPDSWVFASFRVGLGWTDFDEGEQLRVDPVAAWDGLALRTAPDPAGQIVRSLPPDSVVMLLRGQATIDGVPWRWVEDPASGKRGWVDLNYLQPTICSPWDGYYGLAWVPGCDPQRPEVALLRQGQAACDPDVETRDLEWLSHGLEANGLIAAGEHLVLLAKDALPNQELAIENANNDRTGYIRFGGPAPVSGVWRLSTLTPPARVGDYCWLTLVEWSQWDCR